MPRHTLQMMPSHTLLLTISSLLIITDSYSLRPPLLAYRAPRSATITSTNVNMAWFGETAFKSAAEQEEARQVARRARAVPSLPTHYRDPVIIQRGRGTYLFDNSGQPLLDLCNNPAGLGHSHPKVTAAAVDQMQKLNTNARYVYPELANYAEALTATLPAGLDVCFFTNSGSEANDLALRIARLHTKGKGVVCLQGAYHGNTDQLINIAPYKPKPGQEGTAPSRYTAQQVPLCDPLRWAHRLEKDPGAAYAGDLVRATILAHPLTTVACAPPSISSAWCPPCAGSAGGVCIADEVQSGFGRGGLMWGFSHSGVTPDMVTFGKPAGNCFPLAGVVTTAAIARSFAESAEYFNTFGGSPVAMRVGKAVLEAMEEDSLLEHVQDVGAYLKWRLGELQEKHALVADVRGVGLWLGVELVKSRETMEPAPLEANWLIEAARQRGVLLGATGLYGNVLKIKPPLCFTRANADLTVAVLDAVLAEMPSSIEALKGSVPHNPAALRE
ncbi:pyridoxal phosphate-dependent transferase, partial [Baffinella frigidus]